MSTLKNQLKQIHDALIKEHNYSNVMEVPRFVKVVVNIGVGDASHNANQLQQVVAELTQIAGQKPVITRAKKSIAGFKIREGMPIGTRVTLRGDRMYDFLSKLVGVVLPRIRDFRGLNDKGFDGNGNYNIGLKDQLVFPEIKYDKVSQVRGMNITIVTTAKTDMEAKTLLNKAGFPFRKATQKDAQKAVAAADSTATDASAKAS